ncbi:unnamed protein product [Caenorhabditis brenneri]
MLIADNFLTVTTEFIFFSSKKWLRNEKTRFSRLSEIDTGLGKEGLNFSAMEHWTFSGSNGIRRLDW